MTTEDKLKARGAQGLFAGIILLALAAGILVWKLGDLPWYSIALVAIIIIGIFLIVRSLYKGSGPIDMAPTREEFDFVWGYLLTIIGLLGMLYISTDLEVWVLALVAIVMVALLLITKMFLRRD